MTTFAVSLFLPYTIEFDAPPSNTKPSPSESPVLARSTSTLGLNQLSLLANPTPPQTPGLDGEVDPFFSIPDVAASTEPRQTFELRSLAQSDSHVPEWGRGRLLNQPRSKASAVPPATILKYAKAQEHYATQALKKSRQVRTPRGASRERRYTASGWDVQPAIQGNGVLANVVKAATESGLNEHISWVGTLGFPTDSLAERKKNAIEEKLENEYDAMTVYVDDSDFDGHYSHYCKTILWPVLHYQIPDHPKSKAYEDHSWVYYVTVNEAFAERVTRSYKHGDTIWIHDYHLLLVAAMIRKRLPDAKIGFFLHTAFPSSEVFRCLAVRKQLLEGMLGANLVVFQAPEYAHHFLTTCARLLVVEATENGVQLEDRFVNVTSVPIGIVPGQLEAARQDEKVKDWIKVLMDKYRGKHIIVARDKLDSVRGVKQKLLAFERFLKKNPEWKERVVLLQVATSSGNDRDLETTISNIVTRINAHYSSLAHQPLLFLKQDISYAQYLALLTVADVLMVTPLRDGMNLNSHEYILCQDGRGMEGFESLKKHGPLILSEFTGSATILGDGAVSVNPWDQSQCASAIKHALEMTEEEKNVRHEKLSRAVLHNTGERWIQLLDSRLLDAYHSQQQRDTMSVPRLSIHALSEQYNTSKSRLFILDYEGTLSTLASRKKDGLVNTERVIDTVISLIAASDSNIVYITSARKTTDLESLFRAVPNVGLVAENGCFLRPFTTAFQPQEWVDLADSASASTWKDGIVSIFNYYVERIEGSWIEERACSVVFHYDEVEGESNLEMAARQAGDCANHINDSCHALRVRAVPVEKGVLVELCDHNKKTASAYLLDYERRRLNPTQDGRNPPKQLPNSLETLTYRVPASTSNSTVCSRRRPSYMSDPFFSNIGEKIPAKKYSPTHPPDSAVDVGSCYFSDPHHQTSKGHSKPMTPSAHAPVPSLPDFIMVAGDNRDDEPVFNWANNLMWEGRVKNVISVCVGKRNTTEASTTLTQGVTGLLTVLQKLSRL